MEETLAAAGTLSFTAVIVAWGLWLAAQVRGSRIVRLLPLGIVPCVATPLVLAGVLAEHVLSDVANGTLLVFALIVSIGTLLHASRPPSLERSPSR